MKLYHGTNRDFDKIDLSKSKPNKNFGRSFYLSTNYEQALNMAQVKVEQLETDSLVVLTYEIADDDWDDLHVLHFDSYSEDGPSLSFKTATIPPSAFTRVRCSDWPYRQ